MGFPRLNGSMSSLHVRKNCCTCGQFWKLNSLAIDRGCGQIHLLHVSFSHVQSLHSTDDLCAWLKFELRPQNIHSSTRHVSPCASQYTEHQHKFSLTYLSCETRPVVDTSNVKIHGKVVLQQKSTPPHSREVTDVSTFQTTSNTNDR